MKNVKSGCDLSTCFLCKGCLPEWKTAIACHRQIFQFQKNEVIFTEGDELKGIYFLLNGVAKVHKHWGPDKELVVRFARSGEILGHRGLGKDIFYPVSATALEPVTACFFPIDFFLNTLRVNHNLTYDLMMFYASELKESERKMTNLVHMPVKGRLAYTLLFLQEKFGADAEGFIDIRLSRQDLASFAGTTYETAFRMFNEMQAENAIFFEKKRFRITDSAKMESYMAGGQ